VAIWEGLKNRKDQKEIETRLAKLETKTKGGRITELKQRHKEMQGIVHISKIGTQ